MVHYNSCRCKDSTYSHGFQSGFNFNNPFANEWPTKARSFCRKDANFLTYSNGLAFLSSQKHCDARFPCLYLDLLFFPFFRSTEKSGSHFEAGFGGDSHTSIYDVFLIKLLCRLMYRLFILHAIVFLGTS